MELPSDGKSTGSRGAERKAAAAVQSKRQSEAHLRSEEVRGKKPQSEEKPKIDPKTEEFRALANELVQKEIDFVRNLQIVDLVYLTVLPLKLNLDSNLERSLQCFQKIHMIHDKLLLAMLGRLRPDEKGEVTIPVNQSMEVMKSFLRHIDFLKEHSEYAQLYEMMVEKLSYLIRTSDFKLIYESCLHNKIAEGRELMDFLALPLEQIEVFHSCISRFLVMQPDVPEAMKFRDLRSRLSVLVEKGNCLKQRQAKRKDIIDIFRSFGDDERIIQKKNRKVLKQGYLQKYGRNGFASIRIVLFSDALLIGKTIDGVEQIRRLIDLKWVTIKEVSQSFLDNAFTISSYNKSLIVQAESKSEKDSWIQQIQKTLKQVMLARLSKGGESNVHFVDKCSSPDCQNDRSLKEEERFICRCCCRVFCLDCSSYYDVLDGRDGEKELLVPFCKSCYSKELEGDRRSRETIEDAIPDGWTVQKYDGGDCFVHSLTRHVTQAPPTLHFFMEQHNVSEALPADWRRNYTRDGDKYYLNDITGETSWTLPETIPPVPSLTTLPL